jgi:hypothetical protein
MGGKNHQKLSQLPTTWKGAWDFFSFIFWILPNLATHSYEWLSLGQHHLEKIIIKKRSTTIQWALSWHRKFSKCHIKVLFCVNGGGERTSIPQT